MCDILKAICLRPYVYFQSFYTKYLQYFCRKYRRFVLLLVLVIAFCLCYLCLLYRLKLYYTAALLFNHNRCDIHTNHWKSREPNRLWAQGMGRLGNIMFIMASNYGLAYKHQRELVIAPGLHYQLARTFTPISNPAKVCNVPQNKTTGRVSFGKYRDYSRSFYPKNKDVEVCCYLQSWKYFSGLEKEIRTIFTFHQSLLDNAQSFLQRVKTSADEIYIGVHVRRGDIAEKKGYNTASVSYIQNAMRYYTTKYSNIHFIVCSDDLGWCKRQELFTSAQGYTVSFCPRWHSESHDLALLSSLNHSVITVGTFGWWAAWLAGGDVVYYPTPYNNNAHMFKNFNAEDFFPPHWIPISD